MSFDARLSIVSLFLLLIAAGCGASSVPTSVPAGLPTATGVPAGLPTATGVPAGLPAPTGALTDLPTPSGPLRVSLSTVPGRASPGLVELALTLRNDGDKPIYLGICGPWEVYHEEDPSRTVWMGICEVDYLGHQVVPGGVFNGTLQVELDAGSYRAGARAYGDCTLGPRVEVSGQEINYGAFADCPVSQDVTSAPIVIE